MCHTGFTHIRTYFLSTDMPLTATKGPGLVDELNVALLKAARYPSTNDFWFRRMLSEANKLKAVNEVEAYNVLAQLYGCVGDADSAKRYIDTAIRIGGGPILQMNKAVILSNLGLFSAAKQPFDQAIDPRSGLFTSRWRLGLSVGSVHLLQKLASQSLAENLEHIESVDINLIQRIGRVMDDISMTDEQLVGFFDTVGELLREKRLFFAGDGPDVCVWDDDPQEPHVSFMFGLAIPVNESIELDEELGHRLFEKHGALPPELIIHFESSLVGNEHIPQRPALPG